jgi:hypothetical protein
MRKLVSIYRCPTPRKRLRDPCGPPEEQIDMVEAAELLAAIKRELDALAEKYERAVARRKQRQAQKVDCQPDAGDEKEKGS